MKIIRGDTYQEPLKFEMEDGSPLNIAGCTIYFTVREKKTINDVNDTAILFQKKITTHSNPSGGITDLSFTIADTTQKPGNYAYDIEIVFPSGDVKSIPMGTFTILPDVTKTNTL